MLAIRDCRDSLRCVAQVGQALLLGVTVPLKKW